MNSLILNKIFYFFSCFIFISNIIFAVNQSKIDSLENKLNNSDDNKKIIILRELIKLSDSTSAKCLNYSYQLLGLIKKYKNYKEEAGILNNIGDILYNWGKYDEALNNYNKALIVSNKIKDTIIEVYSMNHIGNIYLTLKKYNKAKEYFESALILAEKSKNDKNIAYSLKSIGLVYKYLNEEKKSQYYLKNSYIRAFHSSKLEESKNSFELGNIYYSNKNYDKTIKSCDYSLEIAIKNKFKEIISNNYELLSKVYKDKKDYKKSLDYYILYTNMKDSLYNTETHKQIIEIQTKYETTKKQKEIEVLTKENQIKELKIQKNNTLLSSVIAILVLVIVISSVVIDSYRSKKARKKILLTTIETEERERKRFAEDLHDGLAPLLSSIQVYINALFKKYNDGNSVQMLERTDELIGDAIDTTKTIASNLTPTTISKFGFFTAIQAFCDKINNSNAYNIILNIEGTTKRLDSTTEIILYRVILELINNTMKHAEASNININFKIKEKTLAILYKDDGKGFDFNRTFKDPKKGLGLNNIINRINSINGSCIYSSKPGSGVSVKIEVNTKIV